MKATYIDHMGTDLTVVNNAKVSFANESDWAMRCVGCGASAPTDGECLSSNVGSCFRQFNRELKDKDKGLINFLARGVSKKDWDHVADSIWEGCYSEIHPDPAEIDELLHHLKSLPTHWAPFANGTTIQFHIKAPVPIMRQVYKHKVGSVESEESRRYVDTEPEVFYPKFRFQSKDKKQGSSDEVFNGADEINAYNVYEAATTHALSAYRRLIRMGASFEQARFVLPQGTMLQARVSNSLYGWWNLCNQRNDPHAQKEVQDLAKQIDAICRDLFPVSWDALNTY